MVKQCEKIGECIHLSEIQENYMTLSEILCYVIILIIEIILSVYSYQFGIEQCLYRLDN